MGKVYGMGPELKKSKLLEVGDKNKITLKIGVFFDGTLNSIANIDERKGFSDFLENREIERIRKKRKDDPNGLSYEEYLLDSHYRKTDSYGNEYTNVARFFKCFETRKDNTIIPIYIEGIGTKPRKIDDEVNYSKAIEKKIEEDNKGRHFHSDNRVLSVIDDGLHWSYDKYKTIKDAINAPDDYDSLNQFIEDNEGFVACSDDGLASALGVGLFGVKKKVESACEKITEKVNEVVRTHKKLDRVKVQIELYVFGFSRGAAAARCFSASLRKREGKTKVNFSAKSSAIGAKNLAIVRKKLKRENTYKISLEDDWLFSTTNGKDARIAKEAWITDAKVKFLGLYDTVSSYGYCFDDDVEELSLGINDNVESAFQLCAGDEYRMYFALTDITSAGEKGGFFILPGSHSDVGGGYAHPKKEQLKQGPFYSGRKSFSFMEFMTKGKEYLWKEGWFKKNETERKISNLYSIIPFLLMKDKIVGLDTIFSKTKLKKYKLPPFEGLNIDGIKHKRSKNLKDFYKILKEDGYNACYEIKGGKIIVLPMEEIEKVLKKEEIELSDEISKMKEEIQRLESEGATAEFIAERKKAKRKLAKKYRLAKLKLPVLKRVRHDYLHLSANYETYANLFANRPDKGCRRTIMKG